MTTHDKVEILVLATMSAGKSTLLNALIGKELLPAANQATTARIFCIQHKDQDEFEVCTDSDKESTWIPASHDVLSALNAGLGTHPVQLRGRLLRAEKLKDANLVIYDTPGPNNSMDEEHANTTLNIMKDGQHGLVIYLMNATQLAINDDSTLLRELKEVHNHPEHSHKKVLFLLNKADQLDEERGEDLNGIVKSTVSYLESHGFHHPVVLAISAQAALLARQSLAGNSLTRGEKNSLKALLEYLGREPDRLLSASTLVPEQQQAIKQRWQQRDTPNHWLEQLTSSLQNFLSKSKSKQKKSPEEAAMENLVYASGVYALESSIQDEVQRLTPITVYMDYTHKRKRLIIGNKMLSSQHELAIALNNESADVAAKKIINAVSKEKRPINLLFFTADSRVFEEARKSAKKAAQTQGIKITNLRLDPLKSNFIKNASILSRVFPIK